MTILTGKKSKKLRKLEENGMCWIGPWYSTCCMCLETHFSILIYPLFQIFKTPSFNLVDTIRIDFPCPQDFVFIFCLIFSNVSTFLDCLVTLVWFYIWKIWPFYIKNCVKNESWVKKERNGLNDIWSTIMHFYNRDHKTSS